MAEIYKEKLKNGATARVTDQSRQVAGDRWYIKLVCTVTMPFEEGMIKVRDDDSPELLAMIRDYIGNEVMREFVQERNFVDAREKDEVAGELLARVKENISGYLASAKFPALFRASCYEQARSVCLTMVDLPVGEQSDDDSGPADFSDCFQD